MSKKVLIVGEAWGADEDILKRPFVGASGCELVRMAKEAGFHSGKTTWDNRLGKFAADWSESEFYLTNLVNERPPGNDIGEWFSDRKTKPDGDWVRLRDKWVKPNVERGYQALMQEVKTLAPNLIIAAGNTSMWALTDKWGVTKWRGSQLYTLGGGTQIIPILHPAAILRQWRDRQCTVQDLRRAARYRDSRWTPPQYNFLLRPTYENAIDTLNRLSSRLRSGESLWLSFDIETRNGHIACAGISWTRRDAICIPFMCAERATGYWPEDQECEIVRRLGQLLTHPLARVIGQNVIYDTQYTWKWWGFSPRVAQDTMISQHAVFSDLPKALGFLGSMYADYYVYWKDEGKNWDPKMGEEQLWHYNCLDCTYTFEVAEVLRSVVSRMGLEDVHTFQQHMFWPVLRAMQIGVRVDTATRNDMIFEVQDEISKREQYLLDVLGHPLNPDSPKQMHALFYEDFKLPVQMSKAAKGKVAHPTLDDDAMMKLAQREPLIRPLVAAIGDIRTLRKFISNFLTRRLDTDGRWRCSINIGGSASGKSAPKTYRLSTSESAFDTGANMQNIPSEKSKSIGKAAARAKLASIGDPYALPNIRSIFVPDPGYVWIELDLQRADLFVVVYEADDKELKRIMHLGADIHLANSFTLTGKPLPPLEELIEDAPGYAEHRKPMKLIREFAKVWCHGTNYGGQPPTMAKNTGRSIEECQWAQSIWFKAHPGIPRWQNEVRDQAIARRFVANKLGYRWYIFDRVDSVIPEAIAWGPQSTVSVVINRIWMALFQRAPWIQVLIQVHDALCMQVPMQRLSEALPIIRECAKVVIPYPDPLVIPHSLWLSPHSWGCACDECKDFNKRFNPHEVAAA
jgi:DNA polymerase I-like protein with 3'-5' exonuclease and polymerase domains/uracil-DNA glycosylase